MGMTIRGLHSTQAALNLASIKMNVLRTKLLDRFARKIRDVAKENTPVETGALQESIFNHILKSSAREVIAEVIAGSDTVIRGEGRFTRVKKGPSAGKKASTLPTSEYAEAAEFGINSRKGAPLFMETAFRWAKKNINREMGILVRKVLRGL